MSAKSRPSRALLAAVLACLITAVPLTGCSLGGTDAGSSVQVPPVPQGPVTAQPGSTAFETAADQVLGVVVFVGIDQSFSTPQGTQNVPVGNGSGIVISPDGYILTNNHVVAGSNALTVGLGRTQLPAKVVGRDPSSDIAVIKVDRSGLATATIGDPKSLRRGQWVIAVGSPYGLERTVTSGIVSALNRSTVDASSTAYTNMIQTDAAINPGNSGGALATLDGRIVGMTSLADSPTGASAGIGLAIPIDFAMDVAAQLIRTGHAMHPYIGVSLMDVDSHVALMLGLTNVSSGAMVQQFAKGSTAQQAGMQVGDVITSVGGQTVADTATFFAALRQQSIGATVPVRVVRNGRALTLQVKVAAGRQG